MIRFACSCGRQLQARDELAGRRVRCPSCKLVRKVPGDEAEDLVEEIDEVRESRPRRRRPKTGQGRREQTERDPAATSVQAAWSLGLGLGSFFGLFMTGVPAVVLGVMALGAIGRSRGRLGGRGFAITGIIAGVVGTLILTPVALMLVMTPGSPRSGNEALDIENYIKRGKEVEKEIADLRLQNKFANQPPLQDVDDMQAEINLRELVWAMNAYKEKNGTLPAPGGGPGLHANLSWRVALLPYDFGGDLYAEFHLNEAWDSPHNKTLLGRMPRVYSIPGMTDPPGMTHYRVYMGDRAAFPGPGLGGRFPLGRSLADFPDTLAKTILVAEATEAVPWTKPDELVFAPNLPLPRLGVMGRLAKVGMGDGTSRVIPANISEADMRGLITRDGGEAFVLPGN